MSVFANFVVAASVLLAGCRQQVRIKADDVVAAAPAKSYVCSCRAEEKDKRSVVARVLTGIVVEAASREGARREVASARCMERAKLFLFAPVATAISDVRCADLVTAASP